jgi:hypothetical protein
MSPTIHKIELVPCDLDRLYAAISVAFEGDKNLAKYHIAPASDTSAMVQHTTGVIGKSMEQSQFFCYEVRHKSALVGFTVICRNPIPVLYSFGIKRQCRTITFLKEWLRAVSELFDSAKYAVVLHDKNARAIAFFQRSGFTTIISDKKSKTIALCQ